MEDCSDLEGYSYPAAEEEEPAAELLQDDVSIMEHRGKSEGKYKWYNTII